MDICLSPAGEWCLDLFGPGPDDPEPGLGLSV